MDGKKIELDVTNAHLSMLVQLCDHYGVNQAHTEALRIYVNRRDEILSQVQSTYGVDRDAAELKKKAAKKYKNK